MPLYTFESLFFAGGLPDAPKNTTPAIGIDLQANLSPAIPVLQATINGSFNKPNKVGMAVSLFICK